MKFLSCWVENDHYGVGWAQGRLGGETTNLGGGAGGSEQAGKQGWGEALGSRLYFDSTAATRDVRGRKGRKE